MAIPFELRIKVVYNFYISGSAINHLALIFLLYNIGLNMLLWNSFEDVPGFAAYCSCGVWCRELKTTYTSCTLVICLEI